MEENAGIEQVDDSADKTEELKEKALDYLKRCKSDMDTLQSKRAQLFKEYMSEPYGNEVRGRSQVVTSDIADAIDWIMPDLIKMFYGGKEVVNVNPQGAHDVDKARLMEAKINFDFQKGTNGFILLHDWFKDALLFKLGVVKYWWEKKEEYKRREFSNITQEDVLAIQQNRDFTIDEISTIESTTIQTVQDPYTGQPIDIVVPILLYTVKGREIKRISRPQAQALPPEEFIFNIKDRYVGETFCAHKKMINKAEGVKYGLSKEDLEGAIESFETDALYQARYADLGGTSFVKADDDNVYLYECYLNEFDESGEKHPMIITIVGDRVVKVEENSYGVPPFCDLTPSRMQHRILGQAMSELVSMHQKLKTALTRFIFDNIYYQNNGRNIINPYRIRMDDYLDANHPGGFVQTLHDVDPSSCIANIPVTPMPPWTMQIVEMVDMMKENRSGTSRLNQGLEPGSINKTATGISQIMSASQQKKELIARVFAETGVKKLFQAFIDMNIDYFDSEQILKVNDEWMPITKEMIDGEFDLTIEVGIGLGAKEMQFNQMMNMLNVYAIAMNTGAFQMTPDKLNNMLKEMWQLIGFKNPGRFLPTPGQMPIPPEAMAQMGNMAQMPSSERNMDMSQGGMLGLQ